jgi:hypothetical protein
MTDETHSREAPPEHDSSHTREADAPPSGDPEAASQLAEDIGEVYERVREEGSIRDIYDKNPYAVLASAAGVGYALGGGLLTPFTKRVARIGMKAVVVPFALSRLKELTQAATQPELEESDDSSELGELRPSEGNP